MIFRAGFATANTAEIRLAHLATTFLDYPFTCSHFPVRLIITSTHVQYICKLVLKKHNCYSISWKYDENRWSFAKLLSVLFSKHKKRSTLQEKQTNESYWSSIFASFLFSISNCISSETEKRQYFLYWKYFSDVF